MGTSGIYKQGKTGADHSQFKIKKKVIVIWDEVMWYAYVDLSEIKLVEYHVREEEPAQRGSKAASRHICQAWNAKTSVE